jgi:hypothetical protein
LTQAASCQFGDNRLPVSYRTTLLHWKLKTC